MRRRSLVILMVLALAGAVYASGGESVKLKGYIVDNACSARATDDNRAEKAQTHSVKCALMPNCAKSGYSVVTAEGKMYKLDDAGNQKVAELLKNTKVEKGFTVAIEGMIEGDMIKVESVSEATAAN